jgi:hypothetical protein
MSFKRKREREAMASLIIPRDEDIGSPGCPGSANSVDSVVSGPRSSHSRYGYGTSPPVGAAKTRQYEIPVISDDILSMDALCNTQGASAAAQFIVNEKSWSWVCNSNPFRARKQSRYCETSFAVDVEQKKAEYLTDGFVVFNSFNPMMDSLTDAIVKGIYKLRAKGFPPTFFLLLDECWELIQMFSNSLKTITENKYCNFDILAWVIEPNGAGFSPHRDRQPDEVATSFHSNGFPKYCTCWVALTEASPENSCLYMIPKWADPGYAVLEGNDTDPMREALKDKHDYQNIRALPLTEGNSVVFSHRILHWGSKATSTRTPSRPPRISMAFAFSDDSFEKPYLNVEHLPLPPFELRVALACAQMIIYYQRFQCDAKQLFMFKSCFEAHEVHFEENYKRKVRFEYASAIMEIEKGALKTAAVDVSVSAPFTTGAKGDDAYSKVLILDGVHSNTLENGVSLKEPDQGRPCKKQRKLDSCKQGGCAFNKDDDDDDLKDSEISNMDDSESDNDDGGFQFGEVADEDDPVEAALEEMLDNEEFTDDFDDERSDEERTND